MKSTCTQGSSPIIQPVVIWRHVHQVARPDLSFRAVEAFEAPFETVQGFAER
jgi:hypothetical protein